MYFPLPRPSAQPAALLICRLGLAKRLVGVFRRRVAGRRANRLVRPLRQVPRSGWRTRCSSRPCTFADEKQVAYRRDSSAGKSDLWIYNLSRGTDTRLTSNTSDNGAPVWSPDGDQIVFLSNATGVNNLYRKATTHRTDEPLLPNRLQEPSNPMDT